MHLLLIRGAAWTDLERSTNRFAQRRSRGCLEHVISHPAVTVARVGTTKATHMLDNLGGGSGRLPDEAARKRMAEFIDALPLPAPTGGLAPQEPTALVALENGERVKVTRGYQGVMDRLMFDLD